MADPALAARLSHAQRMDHLAGLLTKAAEARGLAFEPAALATLAQPDPLGLARFVSPLLHGTHWPPPCWLPVQIAAQANGWFVDWAYVGPAPLTDPFFEEAIRRALSTPFGRLFRYRMTLADFLSDAERVQSLVPTGLIFHMSRCGSTLAAQMLAAVADTIVVSEAAPIDAIVQLGHGQPGFPPEQHAGLLRAIIAAYGRRRAGIERRYFLKLDSWHMLALPLFRRALPSVPWVFLYREPVEVLVSQMRQRGIQMVADYLHPSVYDLTPADTLPAETYCARVLARICDAALSSAGDGGLLVNYRELPDAMFTRVLAHFDVTADEDAQAAMRLAARQDAKAPQFEFTGDSDAKRRQASTAVRDASERYLGEVYRALEAARGGA